MVLIPPSTDFWFGVEACDIGVEAEGYFIGTQPKLRQRVPMHAMLVFGVRCQEAPHAGFHLVGEAQIAMGINPPDGSDGVAHQAGVIHIEETAWRSVCAITDLHRTLKSAAHCCRASRPICLGLTRW